MADLQSKGHRCAHARIVEQFALKAEYDVVLLGSQGPKDTDLLVVNHRGSLTSTYESVTGFLSTLIELVDPSVALIVKHEHRAFISSNRNVLHLMYYPSYSHFVSCELPSLLAYVHDAGTYVSGSKAELNKSYQDYRNRRLITHQSLLEEQLARYTDFAILNLIYLTLNSPVFPLEILFENCLYCLRFMITELLIEEEQPTTPIQFWNRSGLWRHLLQITPKYTKLISYLRCQYPYSVLPHREEVGKLFLSLLRGVDSALQPDMEGRLDSFLSSCEENL